MKRNISLILLSIFYIISAFNASAVKAYPGIIEYEQPDGSLLPMILTGDEHFHYATTVDGFLILPTEDSEYQYAVADEGGRPILSGIKAKSASLRSPSEREMLTKINSQKLISSIKLNSTGRKGKGLAGGNVDDGGSSEIITRYTFSSSAFPVYGSPHSLVVLVEYPDYGFSMADPNKYYTDFLNKEGFSQHNGTGSCRDYFVENSKGKFKPTFDLYGPVMMKNKRSYYGSNDDENAAEMVVEAVKALDDTVDFSQYDHNGDGYVDSIYIIYAEKGEADGGPASSVWPHSWELEDLDIILKADGVKFNMYGCSNELRGKTPVGIGTFVHEFAHVMGLPDLYNNVSYSDYSTPLSWSLLDSGPYNNDGRTPPNFGVFERYSLGWMDCREIVKADEYVLRNIADSNEGFILTTEENPHEFFLLENRQQEGWDKYLPGHGMLVWHIDFVQRHWDQNTVNDNKNHQYVKLIRADNKPDSRTLAADPFPGTGLYNEWSILTNPKLLSWKQNELNVTGIYDIYETDGIISLRAEVSEERIPSNVEAVESGDGVNFENNIFTSKSGSYDIFDISGRSIGTVTPGKTVPVNGGVYIVGGKKYIAR